MSDKIDFYSCIEEETLKFVPTKNQPTESAEKREQRESVCFLKDEIFLERGRSINLSLVSLKRFIVENLKEEFGDRITISINFAGSLALSAGCFVVGKSFRWLAEQKVTSKGPGYAELVVELPEDDQGFIVVTALALEDSVIFVNPEEAEKIEVKREDILYKFLRPTYELCCEQPLYLKFTGSGSWYSFDNGSATLAPGTRLNLLTYFNCFAATKWHKYTNVRNLTVWLDIKGTALVGLVRQTVDGAYIEKFWRISGEERSTWGFPLEEYREPGLIGLEIRADSACEYYGGGYLTGDPVQQEIDLCIGITTYKREEAVKNSVSRLADAIDAHPFFKDKITIQVVDNGASLKPEDVPRATLISNRNLGGSGGFMRNLINMRDSGKYTHCLFMDDDAFCEPDSIFRAMKFLSHTEDPKLAIIGGMLNEHVQFMQWEVGAWFDKGCHRNNGDLDLRDGVNLAKNEVENEKKRLYGGWWFFMFPIKGDITYSFPFFVRGDDVQFSYLNDFKLVSLNGVCSWQEDFKYKESPQTVYFDIRSHVLHHMILPQIEHGRKPIFKMIKRLFNIFNNSYQYDTAKNIVAAFNDSLGGMPYWINNIDTADIRERVKKSLTYEREKPLRETWENVTPAKKPLKLPVAHKFIQKYSFNGHLLPKFMLNQKRTRIDFRRMPNANNVFLRNKVLVTNNIKGIEKFLGRNSSYYFKNLLKFYLVSLKFALAYPSLKKKYGEFMERMNNADFWKGEFNKGK